MKIQRQFVNKRGDKVYHKNVINLPQEMLDEAGFKPGDELAVEAKKGEIKLKKK